MSNVQKFKIILVLVSISLLGAGCGVFSQPAPGGIVKTVNGGTDWQFANKFKGSSGAGLQAVNVSKLAFSPNNREVIFAGSYNGGLYKSEDSAGSWSKLLSKISIYDFALNPWDEKVIYAAGMFGTQGKVVKSSDGGASWADIYSEAAASNAVRSIALNPNNVNQVVIGMTSGNVIISNDAGLSWKLVKNFEDRVNRILWQNGNIYVLLKSKGLRKSSDLGFNFTDLTASLNKTNGFGSLNYSQSLIDTYSQTYVDLVAPSLIYLSTNKGLYKTTDEGANWTLMPLPAKGSDAQARAIAVARSSSNLLYTSVGSTVYKSTDGGQTFQTQTVKTGGLINYILVDPQLSQIAYAGIYVSSD